MELLIRDCMKPSANADAFASHDIFHLAPQEHLDPCRKSTGVMETKCVTGEPGTGVF